MPPSIKAARDFTTDTLLDWDLRGLIQDATLVVSELVTNALRHGALDGDDGIRHDRPELILWARAGYLVCVVIDSSASPPVRVPAGLAREDGRGLQVVQALASRWGWSMLGVHRKAVWAVLDGAETAAGAARPRLPWVGVIGRPAAVVIGVTLRSPGGRAVHAGPRRGPGGQTVLADRLAAPLAGPVAGCIKPLKSGVGIGETAPGLVNERRDVLPLESVGRALRVVLVVSGR